MTVLGFGEREVDPQYSHEVTLWAELSECHGAKYIYGLYFNEKNPERQEVISIKKQDYLVIHALEDEDSRKLAVGSPFYNIKTLGYFFDLLQGGKPEYSEDSLKYSMLCNYLIRGFSTMISVLKKDYVTHLKQNQLSKPLLNRILSLAGQQKSTQQKT